MVLNKFRIYFISLCAIICSIYLLGLLNGKQSVARWQLESTLYFKLNKCLFDQIEMSKYAMEIDENFTILLNYARRTPDKVIKALKENISGSKKSETYEKFLGRQQLISQKVTEIVGKYKILSDRNERLEKTNETLSQYETCRNERISTSKILTEIVQNYNFLQCIVTDAATITGGYCNSEVKEGHMTGYKLARTISLMFANKSIASFGDGRGEYKKLILSTGRVTQYDSFDGAPNIESVTNNSTRFLDLTIPNYGLPIYDWVFSIEVAEHIPERYEDIYLDNVIRHAREGIVLSWAIPDQYGFHHVNLRPPEYVVTKLGELCFDMDGRKSRILKAGSDFEHLQRNLMVFVRRTKCPVDDNET